MFTAALERRGATEPPTKAQEDIARALQAAQLGGAAPPVISDWCAMSASEREKQDVDVAAARSQVTPEAWSAAWDA